jgi:hypothetical protein
MYRAPRWTESKNRLRGHTAQAGWRKLFFVFLSSGGASLCMSIRMHRNTGASRVGGGGGVFLEQDGMGVYIWEKGEVSEH